MLICFLLDNCIGVGPWDSLPSLKTTLASIQVPKQVDYGSFLFFFCEDVRMVMIFKVENNSLELTRIFKENIMTDCEREKKV